MTHDRECAINRKTIERYLQKNGHSLAELSKEVVTNLVHTFIKDIVQSAQENNKTCYVDGEDFSDLGDMFFWVFERDKDFKGVYKNVYFENLLLCYTINGQQFNNCTFKNCIFDCKIEKNKFYNVDFNYCRFDNISICRSLFDNVTFFRTIVYGSGFRKIVCKEIYMCECALFNSDIIDSVVKNSKIEEGLCSIKPYNCKFRDVRIAYDVHGLITMCPEKGSFIGYKKAVNNYGDDVIVTLLIPENALRSSSNNQKCRCDKAVVLKITDLDCKQNYKRAHSLHDYDFVYTVGDAVTAYDYDTDRWKECSAGIHFFMNEKMAIDYNY